ncbi:tyrosine-protein phosphatase [Candidatus Margulisiibacteriota bacterium]
MIDIHNHILFGLDDGPEDITSSIEMAKGCVELGYKKVFCSPHVMSFYYENNALKIEEKAQMLREKLSENNINLELDVFAEVYLDETIYQRINNQEIPILGNKILVEGPLSGDWGGYVDEMLFFLKTKNIQPIIAHIERYDQFHKKIDQVWDQKNDGAQLQANILSILGYYGTSAKECMETLLKEKLIDYLATDMHSPDVSVTLYRKAMAEIKELIGEEQFTILSGAKINDDLE